MASFKVPTSVNSVVPGVKTAIFPSGVMVISVALLGIVIEGTANQDGFGSTQQGFIEGSNVQIVEELINLIQAERAFETNSKIIKSSDEILRITNRLS